MSRARVRRPLLALIVLLLALAIGYGVKSLHSRGATPSHHAARASVAAGPPPGAWPSTQPGAG